jgi:hypothetical protein
MDVRAGGIYDAFEPAMDAGAAPFEPAKAMDAGAAPFERGRPFPTTFPLCPYYYCTCDADAERANRTQCDWCFDKWYFESFVINARAGGAW